MAIALVVALLAMLAPSPALANTASQVERREVRVGYFEFDGYHMLAEDGSRSGYGYDLVQYLARYNDWNVVYVGYDKSWSEMQQMLASGEIDLLTSAQKTPAREALFGFSSSSVGTSSTMLTVRSGNDSILAENYATYQGMRVGMLANNSRNSDFATFAAQKGFSYQAVLYDTTEELTAALQAGTVDAAVTSSLRSTTNEWVLDEFDESPFYVMTRKDDATLLAQVDTAIARMDRDQADWRRELAKRYYTTNRGTALELTKAERDYVSSTARDGVVLRVAVNPDDAPYSTLDETGTSTGVYPSVFATMASRIGLAYEVVPTPTRASYEEAVNSGDVDVVMDSTVSLSQAEQAGYKVCDSYLTISLACLSLRANAPTTGRICTTADVANVIEQQGRTVADEDVEFVTLDSTQACVDAVFDGAYDGAYLYTNTARQAVDHDDRNRLVVIPLSDYTASVSLAVSSKLDARLFSVLDQASHSVSDEANEVLLTAASEHAGSTNSLIGLLYDNPVLAVGAVAVAAALAVTIVILSQRAHNARRERERRLAVERSEAKLQAALDRACEANEAKSTFLSSMSHDMRTPLNGILGYTSLALSTPDEHKRADYLGKIDLSGHLMLDLVNDTLDLSKIESGKMTLKPQVLDAATLLEPVLAVTSEQAEQTGLSFEHEMDLGGVTRVRVDGRRLRQVVLNLLSNAVKYTPRGRSVRLNVAFAPSSPAAACASPTRDLAIVVADTGIGMSKEFLGHAFEPFSQENSESSTGVMGTGLGLSIVRRIVDVMGGTVTVQSEPGKGTTFTVHVPVEVVATQEDGPVAGEGTPLAGDAARDDDATTVATVTRGLRVLLCEDNDLNAEIAETMLRDRGFLVTRARNGREGVELFSAAPVGSFDVVLMDVRMPVMGGIDAVRAIRALGRPDAGTVPVIALSADAYEDDRERCLEAGMDDHIAKPIDPEQLVRVIAKRVRAGRRGDGR